MNEREFYELTWPGKNAAKLEAASPTDKILRPNPNLSKNFDSTQNLYIEGDNLEVLKILQKSYMKRVKLIYIDPPYNTGNDFIYHDDFSHSQAKEQQQQKIFDDENKRNFTAANFRENSKSNPRFHSEWCSMIYSRLKLARNLLTDDGVIFISIDDNEQANLRKICDEIFGEDNFIACFPRVTKKAGKATKAIAKNHDYILVYGVTDNTIFYLPSHTDEGYKFSDSFESERGKYKLNQTLDYNSLQYSSSMDYPITIDGEIFYPGQSYEKYIERKKGNHARVDWVWRWSSELFDFGYKNGFIVVKNSRIYTKTYQNAKIVRTSSGFKIEYIERTKFISTLEFTNNQYSNDNSKSDIVDLFNSNIFEYSKPVDLIQQIIRYGTCNIDIILDFFAGSSTTAHAVMNLNNADLGGNRKFILVQIPESCAPESEAFKAGYKTICDIGRARIIKAGQNLQWGDKGFRVLQVDSGNYKNVFLSPEEYTPEILDTLAENIKPDRNALDLLFAQISELGLPLSLEYRAEIVDGFTLHYYGENKIIACFDKNINRPLIEYVAKKRPERALFRDSCFENVNDMINLRHIFAHYSESEIIIL